MPKLHSICNTSWREQRKKWVSPVVWVCVGVDLNSWECCRSSKPVSCRQPTVMSQAGEQLWALGWTGITPLPTPGQQLVTIHTLSHSSPAFLLSQTQRLLYYFFTADDLQISLSSLLGPNAHVIKVEISMNQPPFYYCNISNFAASSWSYGAKNREGRGSVCIMLCTEYI